MALTTEERQQKCSKVACLTADLSSAASDIGDWKVAKCYEYALAGLEPPYDITELHAKRQAVRDQINALRAELAADDEERAKTASS